MKCNCLSLWAESCHHSALTLIALAGACVAFADCKHDTIGIDKVDEMGLVQSSALVRAAWQTRHDVDRRKSSLSSDWNELSKAPVAAEPPLPMPIDQPSGFDAGTSSGWRLPNAPWNTWSPYVPPYTHLEIICPDKSSSYAYFFHIASYFGGTLLLGLFCGGLGVRAAGPNVQPRGSDGDAGAGPPVAPPTDMTPPLALYRLMIAGALLIAINFTVIMPASTKAVEHAQDIGAKHVSDCVIGCYAIGCCVSIPFMFQCARYNVRAGLFFLAAITIFGNLSYASAAVFSGSMANHCLMVARIMCGIAGGSSILFQVIFIRWCRGAATVQAIADLTGATTLGLFLGPSLSAVTRNAGMLFLGEADDVFPCCCTLVMAACVYCLAVHHCCPTQDQCIVYCGVSTYRNTAPAYTSMEVLFSSLNLVLQSMLNAVRYFQLVVLEATTLMMLTRHHHISDDAAAYSMVCPLSGLLVLPFIGVCYKSMGAKRFIRSMDVCMLVGILLMTCWNDSGKALGTLLFSVGGFYFFNANGAQSAAFAPFRQKHALAGHPFLNLETSTVIIHIVGLIGYFTGPVLGRLAFDRCINQDMLPGFLLVANAAFMLGKEPAVKILLALASETTPLNSKS